MGLRFFGGQQRVAPVSRGLKRPLISDLEYLPCDGLTANRTGRFVDFNGAKRTAASGRCQLWSGRARICREPATLQAASPSTRDLYGVRCTATRHVLARLLYDSELSATISVRLRLRSRLCSVAALPETRGVRESGTNQSPFPWNGRG